MKITQVACVIVAALSGSVHAVQQDEHLRGTTKSSQSVIILEDDDPLHQQGQKLVQVRPKSLVFIRSIVFILILNTFIL